MSLKLDRISVKVVGTSAPPESARNSADRADAAVFMLARLIGRQIAREQFERKKRAARKGA